MTDVWANSMVMSSQSHVSHCRVLPLGEFTVTIPEPYATLQGAVTWRNQCRDRATLQGVRITSGILKIVLRHIFTGRPARRAAMPVLFLLRGPKIGCSPRCPDKREIWYGGADLPNFTFIGATCRPCGPGKNPFLDHWVKTIPAWRRYAKIWRKTIFNTPDGILTPCNVARSRHWFPQVTAPCSVACGSGIVIVNSPSGSTLQCDTWLWDNMPLNSPKRPPYWNSISGFHFHTSPQSTCHYVPLCEILSKSDHPRQKNDVMSIFKMADLSHLGL